MTLYILLSIFVYLNNYPLHPLQLPQLEPVFITLYTSNPTTIAATNKIGPFFPSNFILYYTQYFNFKKGMFYYYFTRLTYNVRNDVR